MLSRRNLEARPIGGNMLPHPTEHLTTAIPAAPEMPLKLSHCVLRG